MSGTHRFLSGNGEHRHFTPTSLYTLRWLDPAILVLNVIGVHLLLPLVAACWLVKRVRQGTDAAPSFNPLRMSALLVSATTYVYLAVLVNAVETLEAMRFREEVEPVVWLITLICVSELLKAARVWCSSSSSRPGESGSPHPAVAGL